MGWVALGRRAGGGGRLPPILSLSLASLASSLILTTLCVLTLALTLATFVRADDIFEEGKSDKEILDELLLSTRYDKRLLPPVQDADFCCGLRWPGDTAGLTNRSTTPNDPNNQNKNQNNNHYTPHQHLRTHLRGTLTVNVSVLLLSLASPDESSLKYEVEFLLQQQWYDPRLRYSNRSRYEFLNAIHHHNDIWLPDTYFIMHGDFKDPLIPVHFALRIYRNGTVNYLMRRHLILSCQGRLNIFPFDDPQCSFAIESISYEQTAITYVWKNDEATLRKSPSLTTLNAYLIRNQTLTCPIKASWRAGGPLIVDNEDEFDEFGESKCSLCQRRFEEQGNYSCLKVDLIFTRDRAFYFTTVFIPGIILVTSSFITFWLEWNAVPARVMIGVTTMLNFFTTSNGFRSTLPVVSNLTAMNVWDGVCMCFIYASLLEFVCVNYVGRKRPLHNVVYRPGENPVTQRLPAVLNRIGIILASPLKQNGEKKREGGNTAGTGPGANEIIACTNCGPNPCTHTATNGCAAECCFVQVRKKEPPHPIRVAKTIDVIARITFPIAYFMFLTFFFIHLKGVVS
ncbi:glutamate-gated chloride channel isoform X1 [Venturia canescens]|uniref:glutamate-gated chloride channel isoform X1 n=1 Tax=Venturia canescens TaxID=32260 RepID=UPI001C9BDA13|nr:glutamate-gated chloride channel isoform X1 [Venturia canescens]XP_043285018.1 glutamate-gated chloride channel isoform X1 [Venturia canescens]XP_043285025.1 glutamate-gated chloride channel isoform X1 [Venturia canescens]XP_043285033.1 glutamate-gated chloride channel isoform X1 [Venturia canescens]XP_043285043.1 glutamate-gated chloride channel isoform X1 [Venturia canescens]XP_043285052.1 glutamate-gated chloride channel isoform X1 [Venturia canescens]XP_043285061.1 glutamate-gated chlo